MTDMQKRVAIVTGGGSGIGAATALALASSGVGVVVADVALASAEAVAAKIRHQGGEALPVLLDVTSPDSICEMMAGVHGAMGAVHILVNNAGICPTTPLADINLAEWNRVLAVNLTGTFLCTQAVLADMMAAKWGRIINIASLAGQVGGIIVGAHYAASKGGILAFTKTLARIGAPHGITANAIAPGTVETPMRESFSAADRDKLIGAALIRRPAQADEITAGVLYLASEAAGYVTGQTLNINGGAFML
jgi:NAD(P)-dependent dehydrogenase (short-subunit alcohol dehydrogenase family)